MKRTVSDPKSRPRTAGRPPGSSTLSKRRIAEAALAHIDEFGLGAFSMREIAARLGVYPATVHWHVSTREALLAEVAAMHPRWRCSGPPGWCIHATRFTSRPSPAACS